jgi:hypothetical protein
MSAYDPKRTSYTYSNARQLCCNRLRMQTRRIDDARVPKSLAQSMATGIAALVVFLAASLGCPAGFAAESKRIMLLHSFGRDFKPWSEYARAIRSELVRQSPWPLDIVENSLVTARYGDEDPEAPFVDYLRALFAKRPLDLIVSIGAPAANFVQRHRPRLFATTPMVFMAVDQRRVPYSNLTANDAAVAVRINYLSAFENILQVLPDTKDVIVVVGTSPIEKFWKEAIGKEVEPPESGHCICTQFRTQILTTGWPILAWRLAGEFLANSQSSVSSSCGCSRCFESRLLNGFALLCTFAPALSG